MGKRNVIKYTNGEEIFGVTVFVSKKDIDL